MINTIFRRLGINVPTAFPRVYESDPLEAPVVITEGGPPTVLSEINVEHAEFGRYRITIGMMATYEEKNDTLIWRVTGSWPTGDFTLTSRLDDERRPFYFSMTEDVEGFFDIGIEAETTGPGPSNVSVDTAEIYMVRIG